MMTDHTSRTGNCLCGKIQVTASSLNPKVGACHCGMCRKWSGGPFMAVDCGTDVSISGEENLTVFDSSAWAQRGFCKHCGSHIFYQLKETKQYIMSTGLFNDIDGFVFDHQIFIDKKPPYYNFENQTENMTEAEVFAKFT